ncbi:unnamed protein product [Didymodactylos carnosus]|uniref:DUF2238 domain-containing protein n=1 Tax=Didymodactylos carnosus TaxID=1234261 RepID=A0A813Z9B0_9BILA|nr:unnamed protein product [Didymodactylos carnosus]CAF0895161.1 unnamed protein product [Didymodactylos carnosus]CAF3611444.1 unnamed protein product [Didymodactylos carnosus]CAF3678612.1 unnamed protein product [Didymodactylos carnosus]
MILFIIILIRSAINPHNNFVWFLEVLPALIGVGLLIYFYPTFKFTNLLYVLVFLHCTVLIVGGHYTYAEVPLFDYLRNLFHLKRNNFDKVGHFAQGFVPVLIVREIFYRQKIVLKRNWLSFICVSVTLSFSAVYELIEWFVASVTGESADAFLGSQGDVWDTQSDMLMCLIGSVISLICLSRIHDKQMEKVKLLNKNTED